MNIQIKTSKNKSWGKALVAGKVLGYNNKQQAQEHLETIYYLGWFRLIIRYEFRFVKYNN